MSQIFFRDSQSALCFDKHAPRGPEVQGKPMRPGVRDDSNGRAVWIGPRRNSAASPAECSPHGGDQVANLKYVFVEEDSAVIDTIAQKL